MNSAPKRSPNATASDAAETDRVGRKSDVTKVRRYAVRSRATWRLSTRGGFAAADRSFTGLTLAALGIATLLVAPRIMDGSSTGFRGADDANGLILEVAIDNPSVDAGGRITAEATFTNRRTVPVDYVLANCGSFAVMTVDIPVPAERPGQGWTGRADAFKAFIFAQGKGPGGVRAMDDVAVLILPDDCPPTAGIATLPPDSSISRTYLFSAEIVAGVPAAPGDMPFRVAVEYLPDDAKSVPTDGETDPNGFRPQLLNELEVTGSLRIANPGHRVVTAGEAVDAMLGDASFQNWLADEPPETWSGANLFLRDMPEADGIVPAGPSWVIEAFRELGVSRSWAIGFVDPITGSLRKVEICDAPCDR